MRKYLTLHPELRAALKKAIEGRASRITWNPTTMLHRMQIVIDVFLRYHGFANHGGLRAYPLSNFNRSDEAGDFKVAVRLHPEMLLGHKDGVILSRDVILPAEKALAWVLWALFAHSPEIGLELYGDYPPFW